MNDLIFIGNKKDKTIWFYLDNKNCNLKELECFEQENQGLTFEEMFDFLDKHFKNEKGYFFDKFINVVVAITLHRVATELDENITQASDLIGEETCNSIFAKISMLIYFLAKKQKIEVLPEVFSRIEDDIFVRKN